MSKIYITKSEKETIGLGKQLGERLHGGDLVFLSGDLGGGKTQFTKGIAEGLGVEEMVISPTFTIDREYSGKNLTLHHLDLYRIHEDRELLEQISEFASSEDVVTVIEWPENVAGLAKLPATKITFEYINDNERKLTLHEATK